VPRSIYSVPVVQGVRSVRVAVIGCASVKEAHDAVHRAGRIIRHDLATTYAANEQDAIENHAQIVGDVPPLLALIYVRSDIGVTPITKRGGAYCDELVKTFVPADIPEEAREAAKKLLRETPHGYKAAFHIPGYWNHNTNHSYVGRGEL
jgi:hypothetical protein